MKKFRKLTSMMLALGLAVGLSHFSLYADSEKEQPKEEAGECCQEGEGKEEHASSAPKRVEDAEPVELAEWNGEFNSPLAYFGDESVQTSLKELADKQGVTPEEITKTWNDMIKSEFTGLKVEGNQVTFYDGKVGEGSEIDSAEYAYDSTYATKHGNFDIEWIAFKATRDDAKFPVLLMMPLHGEDVLLHFHMRYGSDVDSLFENENWWPTFMKSSTTTEQIVEMIQMHGQHEDGEEGHHDHEHGHEAKDEHGHDHDLPAGEVLEGVDLTEWNGFWNNMGAYLKSEELQPAFETLAQNEGKTVEEARVAYKLKRYAGFDGIEFNGEEGTIAFYDGFQDGSNVDPLSKAHYAYKESYKVKHGNFDLEWHVFTTEDEGALYPVVLLMGVHGEEVLTHFHMRYGDDAAELLKKDGWFPTFINPESTFDQLASEITE